MITVIYVLFSFFLSETKQPMRCSHRKMRMTKSATSITDRFARTCLPAVERLTTATTTNDNC